MNRNHQRFAIAAFVFGVWASIGVPQASALSECAEDQLKAAAKDAFCLLKVYAKAAKTGDLPDPEKAATCEDKLEEALAEAEGPGNDCISAQPGVIDVRADVFSTAINDALALSPPSVCQQLKLKAAGKKAKCLLGLRAKEASSGELDPEKVQGCTDKMTAAFAKAETKTDCGAAVGEDAAINEKVSIFADVNALAANNAPPPFIWTVGGAGDQDSAVTGDHSGLIGWGGAINNVSDTALAALANAGVMGGIKFAWVFGQCFGGGMFDELAALGGTQSMVSASAHLEPAFYPLAPAAGNGEDFVTVYDTALAGNTNASTNASSANDNDPWGPGAAPVPARVGEVQGAEHPQYFETAAAGGMLLPSGSGVAVLWSGSPEIADRDQIVDIVTTLVALGVTRDRIYVFYGDGKLGALHPLVVAHMLPVPPITLRSAKPGPLASLFNQFMAGVPVPGQVFFLANDHGYNTAVAAGAAVPREGSGGGYDPDAQNDSGSDPYGGGDSSVPTIP